MVKVTRQKIKKEAMEEQEEEKEEFKSKMQQNILSPGEDFWLDAKTFQNQDDFKEAMKQMVNKLQKSQIDKIISRIGSLKGLNNEGKGIVLGRMLAKQMGKRQGFGGISQLGKRQRLGGFGRIETAPFITGFGKIGEISDEQKVIDYAESIGVSKDQIKKHVGSEKEEEEIPQEQTEEKKTYFGQFREVASKTFGFGATKPTFLVNEGKQEVELTRAEKINLGR